MTTKAVDYSFARPDPDSLKFAGYVGVMRYLAPDVGSMRGKILRADELGRLHAAGLAVGLVWEAGATRSSWNGVEANKQADALGFPVDRPIYFACDSDVPDAQWDAVGVCLDALSGPRPKGIYGGAGLVQAMLDRGHATFGWVSGARSWDHGHKAPGAHLQQLVGAPISGTDENVVLQPDFGQWPAPTPSEEDFMPALTDDEQQALALRVAAIQQQADRIEHALKTFLGDEDGTDERVALFDSKDGMYARLFRVENAQQAQAVLLKTQGDLLRKIAAKVGA